MNINQIILQAPLGAIVQFSNGAPKPPARFTKNLAAWESDHGTGQLTEKRLGERRGFTLRICSYSSRGIKIMEFFRSFSEGSQFDFTITAIPDPGSFLILRQNNTFQTKELLHVADSHAAAELWLAKTYHSEAIIEEVPSNRELSASPDSYRARIDKAAEALETSQS